MGPGIPGVRNMGPGVSKSASDDWLTLLMCLAIPSNLEMQVRKSCLVRKRFLVKKVREVKGNPSGGLRPLGGYLPPLADIFC